MKKTLNTKIVWLSVLLIAIIFASTTFGTFEPFVGTAPGIGNTGIGAGAIAQKAKANYNATGSVLTSTMPTTTTESFWVGPRARAYRAGY
jgi:hypothetical protein